MPERQLPHSETPRQALLKTNLAVVKSNFPSAFAEIRDQFTPAQQEAATLFGSEVFTILGQGIAAAAATSGRIITHEDLSHLHLTRPLINQEAQSVKGECDLLEGNGYRDLGTNQPLSEEQKQIVQQRAALAATLLT